MPEALITVVAVVAMAALAAQAIYFFRTLDARDQAHRDEVKDLTSRIQAGSMADYQALANGARQAPRPPEPEPRLYDETGLLSVPLEDTLDD